eukprot:CAMPEP_0172607696 /NCGR_PEP_ID=MMETSP1068-20121228/27848_1 /TAXON_ID=35684 /ORGANISM="Pseudopedinella elastica, Strain CCMP716" /LENGTH=41 /DNA_ID= /DNA_START= /DNA_END= /DNA_ORIENTATION=
MAAWSSTTSSSLATHPSGLYATPIGLGFAAFLVLAAAAAAA